jgi:hypothetical protein
VQDNKIFCNQKNLIMTEVVNFSKVCSNVYLIEVTRKYECDKVRLGSCLLTFHNYKLVQPWFKSQFLKFAMKCK